MAVSLAVLKLKKNGSTSEDVWSFVWEHRDVAYRYARQEGKGHEDGRQASLLGLYHAAQAWSPEDESSNFDAVAKQYVLRELRNVQ